MLYLASQSPQRSALLEKAGISFSIVSSSCDEESINLPHPQATAIERALAKARMVDLSQCELGADAVILAADTIVVHNNIMIGKPRDRDHARLILQTLQGSTHTVATAHCCLRPAFADNPVCEAVGLALSKVTMKPMSEDQINAYVDSGESDDRAGAYAIQENGDAYVLDIEGDFDNIVGLHLVTVDRLYTQCTNHALARNGSAT